MEREARGKRPKSKRSSRSSKTRKGPVPKKGGRQSFRQGCQEILCAGFGGQGIMFMGKLLVRTGLLIGKHVSWIPSYGAEVRGGTAHSMVKISDSPIANPLVVNPSVCIVMNRPSLLKFEDKVKESGLLLLNKSLINVSPRRRGLNVVKIPATDIASKLGNVRVANMVALGALIKKTKIFSVKAVMSALKDVIADDDELFAINKRAFEIGYKA